MKVLILTANLPYPPASGGAIRALGIIKGLHNAGHTIHLFSFRDSEQSPDTSELRLYCEHIETLPTPHRSQLSRLQDLLLSSSADMAHRLDSEVFRDRLVQLVHDNEYDLIQFEGIEVGIYLPIVREAFPDVPLCYDSFNAEAELQRVISVIEKEHITRFPHALYSTIQSKRIALLEQKLCKEADCIIAVSEEDAQLLRKYEIDTSIHVIPSGITVSDYVNCEGEKPLSPNSLVFTGKMDYRPNVDAMLWFVQQVFPQICNAIPDASLTIVGQKPHPRVKSLTENPNIAITGWVNSVIPYLHSTTVYVAPLRMGSGTRLKLLEAMACQCAIAATSTAAAGLNPQATNTMVIADDPGALAEKIITLIQQPEMRKEMGKRAYQVVKDQYDWSVLIPRLIAVYKGIGLG